MLHVLHVQHCTHRADLSGCFPPHREAPSSFRYVRPRRREVRNRRTRILLELSLKALHRLSPSDCFIYSMCSIARHDALGMFQVRRQRRMSARHAASTSFLASTGSTASLEPLGMLHVLHVQHCTHRVDFIGCFPPHREAPSSFRYVRRRRRRELRPPSASMRFAIVARTSFLNYH